MLNSLPFDAVGVANTATVATCENGLSDHRLRLRHVVASYSGGTPSGGLLTISDGALVNWQIDVTGTTPVVLPAMNLQTAPGVNLTITLAAAGVGVVGTVNGYAEFE